MKSTRRDCCIGLMAFLVLPVRAADDVLNQVRQRLADAPVLRGDFEQRKTLQGFKNPLVSRGDFLLARDRGLVWRTREPFATTLVATRDRVVSRQADGTVVHKLEARDEPGVRAIHEMLFALLAADLSSLPQRFRIEGELRGAQAWALTLVPRDAAWTRWVQRIELEGDRHVQMVRMQEASGDSSVIRFSHRASAASLTADEVKRFE